MALCQQSQVLINGFRRWFWCCFLAMQYQPYKHLVSFQSACYCKWGSCNGLQLVFYGEIVTISIAIVSRIGSGHANVPKISGLAKQYLWEICTCLQPKGWGTAAALCCWKDYLTGRWHHFPQLLCCLASSWNAAMCWPVHWLAFTTAAFMNTSNISWSCWLLLVFLACWCYSSCILKWQNSLLCHSLCINTCFFISMEQRFLGRTPIWL